MKYKAYRCHVYRRWDGSCAVHWGVRDPDAGYYYHHRVGGPACVEYDPDNTAQYQTWDLAGCEYHTEAEYQKALEKWLG